MLAHKKKDQVCLVSFPLIDMLETIARYSEHLSLAGVCTDIDIDTLIPEMRVLHEGVSG